MMLRFLLLLLLLPLIGACESRPPLGPIGDGSIPFDLVLPPQLPAGDYRAVAGVLVSDTDILVGDSIARRPSYAYYAEFFTRAGLALPGTVLLESSRLSRSRGGDTLRLASTFGTDVMFGKNTWLLADSSGDSATFVVPALQPLDSISPFSNSESFVRSDTPLVVTWRPASSSGIYVIWKAPGYTYVSPQPAADAGSLVIPASVMERLRGPGTVWFIRFRHSSFSFKDRTVAVSRLAERTYRLTVH